MPIIFVEAHKEVESFKVIDWPLIPERRIRPRRTLAVALASLCSVMLSMCWIVSRYLFFLNIENGQGVSSF